MAKSKKSNPPLGYKRLQCKYCDHVSERVDNHADAITCYKCVTKLLNGEILELRK
jgi:hypothetical protein